jgi:hypothetical protein
VTIKEDIEFSASFKSAVKSLDKFSKNTSKSLNSLNKGFTALGVVATAAVGFLAGRQVIRGLNAVVKAASDQEQALQDLNTALALAGDFSVAASKDMQKFAEQIQNTTRYEDDLVLKSLSMAKAFGTTNEEAKKLVSAATDLASATGVTLDTAVDQLGKTLQGTTGTLGKTIPGIKNLSKESLAAGGAIDLIANRFGGSAQASVETFAGSMERLNNKFGDLFEEIGNIIIKNPVIISLFKELSGILGTLTDTVKGNADGISKFISKSLKSLVARLPDMIDVFGLLSTVVIGVVQAFNLFLAIVVQVGKAIGLLVGGPMLFLVNGFKTIALGILGVNIAIDTLKSKIPIIGDEFKNSLKKGTEAFDSLLSGMKSTEDLAKDFQPFDDVSKGLLSANIDLEKFNQDLVSGTEAAKITVSGLVERIQAVGDVAKESTEIFEKLNDIATGESQTPKTLTDLLSVFSKTLSDELNKAYDHVSNGLDKKFKANFTEVFTDIHDAANKLGVIFASATATLSEALTGFSEGFVNVVSTAANLIGGVFSGGFLNDFSSIIQQIGNAPKGLLEAFNNLNGIINGVLETLPKVFQKLISKAPEIVDTIAANLPKLASKLAPMFVEMAGFLAEAAPKIAGAVLDSVTTLVEAAPQIIEKLTKGLPKLLRVILQKLPALISAVARAVPEIVKAFADEIPNLIVVFLEELPAIIEALVAGIIDSTPRMMIAFTEAFTRPDNIARIMVALAKAIPQVAIAFVTGAIQGFKGLLPGIFSSLGSAFSKGIKFPQIKIPSLSLKIPGDIRDYLSGRKLVDAIKSAFNKIIEQIKKALTFGLSGGGGGGGLVSGTGTPLDGLATGGTIPKGFPNDTFPARLTSGEMVIPNKDVSRLNSFLDNQESQSKSSGGGIDIAALAEALAEIINARPMEVSVSIGEQQFATAMLNARRRGYRT